MNHVNLQECDRIHAELLNSSPRHQHGHPSTSPSRGVMCLVTLGNHYRFEAALTASWTVLVLPWQRLGIPWGVLGPGVSNTPGMKVFLMASWKHVIHVTHDDTTNNTHPRRASRHNSTTMKSTFACRLRLSATTTATASGSTTQQRLLQLATKPHTPLALPLPRPAHATIELSPDHDAHQPGPRSNDNYYPLGPTVGNHQ